MHHKRAPKREGGQAGIPASAQPSWMATDTAAGLRQLLTRELSPASLLSTSVPLEGVTESRQAVLFPLTRGVPASVRKFPQSRGQFLKISLHQALLYQDLLGWLKTQLWSLGFVHQHSSRMDVQPEFQRKPPVNLEGVRQPLTAGDPPRPTLGSLRGRMLAFPAAPRERARAALCFRQVYATAASNNFWNKAGCSY